LLKKVEVFAEKAEWVKRVGSPVSRLNAAASAILGLPHKLIKF